MTEYRTVDDYLREEHFKLLPAIRRTTARLEAEVGYRVLPIREALKEYERLVVTSRVKECESALDALRRRQQGGTFDTDRPTLYTLASLPDLAGVRVLVFPRGRLAEVDQEVRKRFQWEPDPVQGVGEDEPLALKYHGYCQAGDSIQGEIQIVSVLVGFFWEMEHNAVYKPTPKLKGVARDLEVQQRVSEVYRALRSFEEAFEARIQEAEQHQ